MKGLTNSVMNGLMGEAGEKVEKELRERMQLIERFATALADPDCEHECHLENGLDSEGGEWTLCDCVLKKLRESEAQA